MSHQKVQLTDSDLAAVDAVVDMVEASYGQEMHQLQSRLAPDAPVRIRLENLGALVAAETAQAAFLAGKEAGFKQGVQHLLSVLVDLAGDRNRLQALSESLHVL